MKQNEFITTDTGAVTVDWVVLTAALVGLGLATMGVVSSGVENVATDVDGSLMDNTIIKTSFTDGDLPDLYATFMAVMAANGNPSGDIIWPGVNSTVQANLTGEDQGLIDARTTAREQGDGRHALIAEMQAQIAATGTFDPAAIAASDANVNGLAYNMETFEYLLTVQHNGDATAAAASYLPAATMHNALAEHYEYEMQRRGLLPPG